MTRLLVSVRSAEEAGSALAGGADVIDVKEPSRGALGAAEPSAWREIVRLVDGRAPVSVALGELRDFETESADSDFARSLRGVCWAKLGLAGCARLPDWGERWRAAIGSLPEQVQSVAVIYADWRSADAPAPEAVLATAACARVSVVLIDTYDKSAGHLLNHLSRRALESLAEQATTRQLKLALAGSLRGEHVPMLSGLALDYLAVRGAVCEQGREGRVSEQLVRRLSSEVRGMRAAPSLVATANA